MSHYEYATPENFLGLEGELASYDTAKVVVLPIPYEATVSFGQGARGGPRAIINASRQVELYDREFDCEAAYSYGVHTLPALAPHTAGPEAMVDAITACAHEHLSAGKLLVGLGGEHSISSGFARAIHAIHGDFVLVQIDAHSDLRDSYEGSPYSHASGPAASPTSAHRFCNLASARFVSKKWTTSAVRPTPPVFGSTTMSTLVAIYPNSSVGLVAKKSF